MFWRFVVLTWELTVDRQGGREEVRVELEGGAGREAGCGRQQATAAQRSVGQVAQASGVRSGGQALGVTG